MDERLRGMVRSSPWLMNVLETVRASGLPNAWVGAGTIRDLVWGELYGCGFRPADVRDVDVAYFDPHDLRRAGDDEATALLSAAAPDVPWEARNQAAVHIWYAGKFGGEPVEPLTSIVDALGTWPETATTVAVALGATDRIEVCAPLGLTDLFNGVWRRHPRRITVDQSLRRLARHNPGQRWPGVTVILPS